jgi:hypothetical protein
MGGCPIVDAAISVSYLPAAPVLNLRQHEQEIENMSKTLAGDAVIGQSGGPTAVINQSMVGCIEVLRSCDAIGKILGAHHAVSGIVKNDFIDLTDIQKARLDRIANTPSSALGSSRDKPDKEYCKKIFV